MGSGQWCRASRNTLFTIVSLTFFLLFVSRVSSFRISYRRHCPLPLKYLIMLTEIPAGDTAWLVLERTADASASMP